MTDLRVFREYEPRELGEDGYPVAWHVCQAPDCERGVKRAFDLNGAFAPVDCVTCDGTGLGVKHLVRAEAGHRCVRCGHPYRSGCGEWVGPEPVRPFETQPMPLEFAGASPPYETLSEARRATLWSPCDERCTHDGPLRWSFAEEGMWHDGEPPGIISRSRLEVQAAWRILTVHHLNGRKHDLRWWNLASLCQRCHLLIQKKVLMERVWPAEHTDWFKPYAAGWYAHAYLGEYPTREEVEERMDELLGLERMW